MPKETGEIIELLPEGRVKIKLCRSDGCSSCALKRSCSIFSSDGFLINAENPRNYPQGSLVKVNYEPRGRIKASLIIFLMPILAMIGGYFVGMLLGKHLGADSSREGWGIIFSMIFMAGAFLLIRLLNPYFKRKEDFKFQIMGLSEAEGYPESSPDE
ncbi:SoxR reducing system RseC family protein [bacterium]|nr:SoxR reducing system RseC family protein [bacterium]